jgi:hypothetical protein
MRMDEADPGLVDYYKIAFRVFGFYIESFFFLYFVLLSISVVIFLVAHHQSMALMTVPVLFLAAGNIVLSSDIFSVKDQLISVVNLRFLLTLGLLPALHLAFLMLERQQITFVHGSLAVVQIVLLLLVFSIRSTISWVLPFFRDCWHATDLRYKIEKSGRWFCSRFRCRYENIASNGVVALSRVASRPFYVSDIDVDKDASELQAR